MPRRKNQSDCNTREACTADGTSAESLTSNSVVKERLDMRPLCLCRWRLEKTPVCDYAELELLFSLLAACRCTVHLAQSRAGILFLTSLSGPLESEIIEHISAFSGVCRVRR